MNTETQKCHQTTYMSSLPITNKYTNTNPFKCIFKHLIMKKNKMFEIKSQVDYIFFHL